MMKYLFLVFTCICATLQTDAQNVVAGLPLDIDKHSLQHVSKDVNNRWNFIYLNRSSLDVIITDSSFKVIKNLDVKLETRINKILGVSSTAKYINLFFEEDSRSIALLRVQKFVGKGEITQLNKQFSRKETVLKCFQHEENFYIFSDRNDSLSMVKVNSDFTTMRKTFPTEFGFSEKWKSMVQSYPQYHTFLNPKDRRPSHKETGTSVKLYPNNTHILLTIDEPFKTHLLSIDLSTFTSKETTLNFEYPDNIPISGNITNSFIYDEHLYQAIAGRWGFSIQQRNLGRDTLVKTHLFRTNSEESSSVCKIFKDKFAEPLPVEMDFTSKWNKGVDQNYFMGLVCSGSKSRLQFEVGFSRWFDASIPKQPISGEPSEPRIKIDGLSYRLNSPFEQQEQFAYYPWKYSYGVYACFSMSGWDFTPIKYIGNGIEDIPKIREYEKTMMGNFVGSSHHAIFYGNGNTYYGFYRNRKKEYYILLL